MDKQGNCTIEHNESSYSFKGFWEHNIAEGDIQSLEVQVKYRTVNKEAMDLVRSTVRILS